MLEWLKHVGRDLTTELSALVVCALLVFLRSLRGRLQNSQSNASSLEVQTIKGDNMDKAIVISPEVKVDVKLANGKLFLVSKYDGKDVDADVSVGIEVDLLLDKVKELIPGKIDDALIDVLKAALKVI